jgi:hypothetical protein
MIDWLAVCLSLLGWFLMARHRFSALTVLLAANCAWIAWAFPLHVWSLVTLQLCFIALNIRAITVWRRELDRTGVAQVDRR